MTTTIEPTDVDLDVPLIAPESAAKPDDLTPALRLMVDELDDVYQGDDCPSIDKTAAKMKEATGNKSWDSRGQVDKARKAYRARHGIESSGTAGKPATKKPTVRTARPKPTRTVVRQPNPEPVRTEPEPDPVPPPPAVVQTDPVPQPEPAVRTARRTVRSWPVMVIALPAMVAIWGGWVGLGGLTGFGDINLLPGIAPTNGWATIDSAITLPIGVEAYAAFALRVWLSGQVPDRTRAFARWSAIGSLVVGALGQVAYHLLVAAGVQSAPWQITTLVACLPVAVLGMAAALVHLMREER
ncbi:ABC transporter permease [Micromonospora costi]|uniref:ABC transporter permease n=1 Tax=Micromonospora costi TaxID=1530042 RepID=UPI0033DA3C79